MGWDDGGRNNSAERRRRCCEALGTTRQRCINGGALSGADRSSDRIVLWNAGNCWGVATSQLRIDIDRYAGGASHRSTAAVCRARYASVPSSISYNIKTKLRATLPGSVTRNSACRTRNLDCAVAELRTASARRAPTKALV